MKSNDIILMYLLTRMVSITDWGYNSTETSLWHTNLRNPTLLSRLRTTVKRLCSSLKEMMITKYIQCDILIIEESM